MIDWDAIAAYLKEVSATRRLTRQRATDVTSRAVDPIAAKRFRARASHLGARLRPGSFAIAAWGGLQDSAPRAALLSLHARVEEVRPDAWEHPSLAQIWFRWADYVIPRADLDVFTLGALPRNARYRNALSAFGDAVEAMLDDTRDPATVEQRLGVPVRLGVRSAQVSGRFTIRWDARTVTLQPAPPTTMPAEAARLELARRFLGWHAPADERSFARWAALTRADAEETWRALEGEIEPVSESGMRGWVLARDLAAIADPPPVSGVRFLPGMGDPFLYPHTLPGDVEPTVEWPSIDSRLRNSLIGRILVDGERAGAWGRRQHHLTIAPWQKLDRDLVNAEAEEMRTPIGRPMRITWLDREG